MKIKKYFMKDKNLCLKKPRCCCCLKSSSSSKGGGISCRYSFLGIFEAIFKGRYFIFGVEPHISIYFKDIK